MVREYLTALKNKGNFSWSDLSGLSGLPDATIRKIFSGETADPRLETAMGGSYRGHKGVCGRTCQFASER